MNQNLFLPLKIILLFYFYFSSYSAFGNNQISPSPNHSQRNLEMFQIISATSINGSFYNQEICSLLDGFVRVWMICNYTGPNCTGIELMAQRYDTNGWVIGTLINLTSSYYDYNLDLLCNNELSVGCAELGNGDFVVVTMDYCEIMVFVVTNGVAMNNTFVRGECSQVMKYSLSGVKVVNLTNNKIAVIYARDTLNYTSQNLGPQIDGLAAFICDVNLNVIVSDFQIEPTAVYDDIAATWLENSEGMGMGFAVAYPLASTSSSSTRQIYVRKISNSGLAYGKNCTIPTCDASYCHSIKIVTFFNGNGYGLFYIYDDFFLEMTHFYWDNSISSLLTITPDLSIQAIYAVLPLDNGGFFFFVIFQDTKQGRLKFFNSLGGNFGNSVTAYNSYPYMTRLTHLTIHRWVGFVQNSMAQSILMVTIQPLQMVINEIIIKQGQVILLNQFNIRFFYLVSISTVIISVISTSHCYFELNSNPYHAITSFTYENISNSIIKLRHDGSANDPTYEIQGSEGSSTTTLEATINFYLLPTVTVNRLTIKESKTITVTQSFISGMDNRLDLIYQISNLQNGKFLFGGFQIFSFTQSQLESQQISFMQINGPMTPSYTLSVYDGTNVSAYSTATIIFIPLPIITANQLSIKQGKSINLTPTMIFGTGGQGLTLTFIISNNLHIIFRKTATMTIVTSFTISDISYNMISASHDGTTLAPSYRVMLSDGDDNTNLSLPSITFVFLPTLTKVQITIKLGKTITIDNTMITATVSSGLTLRFFVTSLSHAMFVFNTNPLISISTFILTDLQAGNVQFVHDGSITAPYFQLRANDGSDSTNTLGATILFCSLPAVTINQFTIKQNRTVNLTTANICGKDTFFPLIFLISSVQNGRFQLSSHPGFEISSFTHSQLINNLVQFVHNGAAIPPTYSLVVNDGSDLSSASSPYITFIPLPVITTNTLLIKQGKSLVLTTNNINGSVAQGLNLTFIISNNLHINFSRVSNGSIISSFTIDDIKNGDISVEHDGTTTPPSFNLVLNDGSDSTSPSPASITLVYFPPLIMFLINKITIEQGTMIVISKSMIDATIPSISNIIFTIVSTNHCFFRLATTTSKVNLMQFTQTQLENGVLQLIHDGSPNPPTYTLSISDGFDIITSIGDVTFNKMPILITNQITLKQGNRVSMTNSNFQALSFNDNQITYVIGIVQNGQFELTTNPNVFLWTFNQVQIDNQLVLFVHDNSVNPPIIRISVTDGKVTTPPTNTFITFSTNIVLINYKLTITKKQTVLITQDSLKAISLVDTIDSNNLIFIIKSLKHGKFVLNTNIATEITSLDQQQIINHEISFIHDGSDFPPSFYVTAGFGSIYSIILGCLITYDNILIPMILVNQLTINQGENITITTHSLDANGGDTMGDSFLITISEITHGQFQNIYNPSNAIYSFSYNDIIGNLIQFAHDQSLLSPNYTVTLTNINNQMTTEPNTAQITFNILPKLEKNFMKIRRGELLTIKSSMLSASDLDSDQALLTFYITNVQNGQFEKAPASGVPCTVFTQHDISNQIVFFIHDGGYITPSFQIALSDGSAILDPVPGVVDFIIPRGIGGLKKLKGMASVMMFGLEYTQDKNYLLGSIWIGSIAVINVVNPQSPFISTSLDLTNNGISDLRALKIVNSIAYIISNDQTLVIVSIADLEKPIYLGMVGGASSCNDFLIYKDYIYMACGINGINVVEINNPSSPVIIKTITKPGISFSTLVFHNNKLYILCDDSSGSVLIYDLSTPSLPEFLNTVIINELKNVVNCMLITPDGNTLIAGTQSGLILIDIHIVLSPFFLSAVSLSPRFSLSLSDDYAYLIATGDNSLTIINIQTVSSPTLVDSLQYTIRLNRGIINHNGDTSFVTSSKGLEVIEMFRGLKERLSPSMNSLASILLTPIANQIELTSDNLYCIISGGITGIKIISTTNNVVIAKTTLSGITYMSSLSKSRPIAYITNNGGLTILDITIPTTPNIISTLNIPGGAWGVVLSSNEDYAFITNDNGKGITIVSIIANSNPPIVAQITGLFGIPKMITISEDNNLIFVCCEQAGIAIIDVKDRKNPKIISKVKLSNPISLIYGFDFSSKYVLITSNLEGTFNVLDVTTPTAPKFISTTYIGRGLGGIAWLPNKNYVILQSETQLSVVEVRNFSNPVIVNQITSSNILFTYKIAVNQDTVYIPSFQSFSLYSGNTFFYGSLNSANHNGQKSFSIDLIGVDPKNLDKSIETFNMLDIAVPNEDWPFWIEKDLSDRSLYLLPPSFDSLLSLRSLQLTFGTQISLADLGLVTGKNATDVQNALLIIHAINENRIPIKYFPANTQLSLDISYSPDKLMNLLNSHYFIKYVNFVQNDFLAFNTPPTVTLNSLQSQLEKIGSIKINKEFNFQISDTTFIDLDGDTLSYSAYNLPSWLIFFSDTRKFVGTPLKENIGNYVICVSAFDGFQNSSDYFKMTVAKSNPVAVSFANQEFSLGKSWLFVIPSSTFMDLDGDALVYNASIVDINGTLISLPVWLNFDNSGLRLYGTPKTSDITYETANQRYYQVFTIKLMAKNIADQFVGVVFILTVLNKSPKLNYDNNLAIQFAVSYPTYIKVGQNIDFEFSADTFKDDEGDMLSYTAEGLPSWLSQNSRKITGTPDKTDLGNYNIQISCSDGLSQTGDSFFLQVLNHPPTAKLFGNQSMVLGSNFLFSLPNNTFSDPDHDVLTYTALLLSMNGTIASLPEWLTFDETRILFNANPLPVDILYNQTTRNYFQVFIIVVKAIDIADASIEINFTLTVQNFPPKINPSKTMQKQFSNLQPIINSLTEFKFDPDTFIDENNGTLAYEARLAGHGRRRILSTSMTNVSGLASNVTTNNNNSTTNTSNNIVTYTQSIEDSTIALPDWIKFDQLQQKFSILPTENEVNNEYKIIVIANNGLQSDTDEFSFIVGYSFAYILNYFIKIFSPILAAIGIIAYRITLYNIFFKPFYTASKREKIIIHENYQKNIYLIGKDLMISYDLWLRIKKKHSENAGNWTKFIDSPEFLLEALQNVKDKSFSYIKLEELENDGFLYLMVKGFMIYEAIKEYPRSMKIFTKIKKKFEKKFNQNWYENFVNLEKKDEICEDNRFFPKVEIKSDCSLDSLIENYQLELAKKKSCRYFPRKPDIFDEETLKKEKFLIENLIRTQALGIPPRPPGCMEFWECSFGESLYVMAQDLSEIQCIEENEFDNWIKKQILKFMPSKQNYNNLPEWLNYEIKNRVLIFRGTPSELNVGSYLIRIFDKVGYALKEFSIEVVSEMKPNAKIHEIERNPVFIKEMSETATTLFSRDVDTPSSLTKKQVASLFSREVGSRGSLCKKHQDKEKSEDNSEINKDNNKIMMIKPIDEELKIENLDELTMKKVENNNECINDYDLKVENLNLDEWTKENVENTDECMKKEDLKYDNVDQWMGEGAKNVVAAVDDKERKIRKFEKGSETREFEADISYILANAVMDFQNLNACEEEKIEEVGENQ